MRARLLIFAPICLTALLSGCALLGSAADPVSGRWEGNWYVGDSATPAGTLTCEVQRVASNEWKAIFTAGFGGEGDYEVELAGSREGDSVVFGGDVDLGATAGGVFNWQGEAGPDVFTGVYTSQFISGTFKMDRVR